jgi:ABC-type multidrug transport system fused ATPase/permease subunit
MLLFWTVNAVMCAENVFFVAVPWNYVKMHQRCRPLFAPAIAGETTEKMKKGTESEKALASTHLQPYLGSVGLAMALNVALAIAAAIIGALIGPAFKLIAGVGVVGGGVLYPTELFGTILGPIIGKHFGDLGIPTSELLAQLPLIFVILATGKTTLLLSQWYVSERIGEQISRDIRHRLMGAFLRTEPSALGSTEGRTVTANLSSCVTSDSRLIKDYFSRTFGGMPREILQVVFTCSLLLLLSWRLFAIFVLGIFPAGFLIARLGKQIRKRANRALGDYALMAEWLQQRLLGIETIKHFGTEERELASMRNLANDLLKRFIKAARAKSRTSPLMEVTAIVAFAIVVTLAINLVRTGDISGAVVISFLTSLAMMNQSAAQFGKYYSNMKEAGAAVNRVASVLEYFESQTRERVSLPIRIAGPGIMSPHLSVHDAIVKYSNREVPALNCVTFALTWPKIYCICGQSGAGKSTLVSVICGLRLLDRGHVELSIRDSKFSTSVQTQALCYVPQEPLLLPGSILENVAYPTNSADPKAAWHALDQVGMREAIAQLPQGLETNLTEAGTNLSGGQIQRILLARMWYRPYAMVVIDEGTSALDGEIEGQIFARIRELANSGTLVIMIAHRLTALQFCDELLLLKEGNLAARGSYSELMAVGEFAQLLGS